MKLAVIAAAVLTAGCAQAAEFTVESPQFAGGVLAQSQFADVFGCNGANTSPAISWSGAPKDTKSFVVTLYDEDAPTGSGFWHWVVVDIPANVNSLAEAAGSAPDKLPAGARMAGNDASKPAFLGACPPVGQTHRYKLTVKAIKVEKLGAPDNATGALVGFLANMNKLAEATIVATGSR